MAPDSTNPSQTASVSLTKGRAWQPLLVFWWNDVTVWPGGACVLEMCTPVMWPCSQASATKAGHEGLGMRLSYLVLLHTLQQSHFLHRCNTISYAHTKCLLIVCHDIMMWLYCNNYWLCTNSCREHENVTRHHTPMHDNGSDPCFVPKLWSLPCSKARRPGNETIYAGVGLGLGQRLHIL